MFADTIVYEKKGNVVRIAGLEQGRLVSLDFVDLNKATEGNIYLGRVTKKIELPNN